MKRLTIIACVLLSNLMFVSAFALEATINFPQGLTPGQKVPVEVSLSEDASAYKGAFLGLTLDGGQNNVVNEVNLGKVGESLHGEVTANAAGVNHLSLKLNYGGKRIAQEVDLQVPAQPGTIQLELASITQRRVPLPQYLMWILGAAALGALAFRGKDYLF